MIKLSERYKIIRAVKDMDHYGLRGRIIKWMA